MRKLSIQLLALAALWTAAAPVNGQPNCVPAPAGLAGWWSGDGHASDLAGTNNGKAQGAGYTPGKVGQAFSFDGVDDYVGIPHSAGLNPTNEITVAAWIRPRIPLSQQNAYVRLVDKNHLDANEPGYGQRGYALITTGNATNLPGMGRIQFLIIGAGPTYKVAQTPGADVAPTNLFTFVVGTYESALGRVRLYINGNLVHESVSTPMPIEVVPDTPLTIGADSARPPFDQFRGDIDEVTIFNRSLTASEVAAIYAVGSAGMCHPAQNGAPRLIHRWSFSETNGTAIADSVAGSNGQVIVLGGADYGRTNGQLRLFGGARATADYAQFPSGLLRGLSNVTIEAWITPRSFRNWSRAFDFGSGTNTVNTFFLSLCRGTNGNQQRLGLPLSTGDFTRDTDLTTVTGQEYHHVVIWSAHGATNGGGLLEWYRDGVMVAGTNTGTTTVSNVGDTVLWLGRSQFTTDDTADAEWSELRMYDGVLDPATVLQHTLKGPDDSGPDGVAGLIHRWSFSETNGTSIADSEGGASGQIVVLGGADYSRTNGQLRLSGGARTSADYGQLPDNLLAGLSNVTIEVWATPQSFQSWSRLFDFGSGVDTTNTFFLSLCRESSLNQQRLEFGVPDIFTRNSDLPTVAAQQYHYSVTWSAAGGTNGGGRLLWYRDATLVGGVNTGTNTVANVDDTVLWLGRSQYTGDNTANADWNELRIYNRVLSQAEINFNQAAGPENLGVIPPANDSFASGVLISGLTNTVVGSNVGATKEVPEPSHAGNAGGHSVWWIWTAPAGGTVVMDTIGSSFDTLLAVYTGDFLPSVSCLASNDDITSVILASQVSFPAVAGTKYHIAVDGYRSSSNDIRTGSIVLRVEQTPMHSPFAHTQPPTSITETKATMNGMATPNGRASSAKFEWYSKTGAGGGHTDPIPVGAGGDVVYVSALLTNLNPGEVYSYYLFVQDDLGPYSNVGAEQQFVTGGNVGASGYNVHGQTTVPADLTNAVAIAGCAFFSGALRNDQTFRWWGTDYGQRLLSDVVAFTADDNNSGRFLMLKSNGTVWALSPYGPSYPYTSLPGFSNVIMVAGGSGGHSLLLRSDGTVGAVGDNDYGQADVPAGLSNVVLIAAGGKHSLAVRNDGTVVAWGRNDSGQCTVPTGLTDVVGIAAGGSHSLALLQGGTVVAWGKNDHGQTNVPAGLAYIRAIAAGYDFSLAMSSGCLAPSVWGDTTNSFRIVPIGWVCPAGIAAGSGHELVLGSKNIPDSCCNGLLLEGTNIVIQTANIGATKEVGEPTHSTASGPSDKSIWHTWTAPSAGGVVVSAYATIRTPILAVYTNSGFPLGKLVDNSSSFYGARVSFTAQAGVAYKIALDGSSTFGDPDEGIFTLSLTYSPSPSNDLFASSTSLSGNYYVTSNSFLGSGRETGETNHGAAAFGQTLWWSWTAPTDSANSNVPVRLMADAVSFAPVIGVYTGNSVTSLTPVPTVTQTNGFNNGKPSMTRTATFTATPGTTYHIALAGQQHDPAGNVISPRYGDFRFRLNVRALSLSVTNGATTENFDGSRTFTGVARVSNLGPINSHPLRLRVSSLSGVGVQGQDSGYVVNEPVFWSTNDLGLVAAGQTVSVNVSGTIPAKTQTPPVPDGSGTGVGYGAFVQLEEQPFPNAWFTVDHMLAGFDDWPALGVNPGPGGGVIRLDPDYVGFSLINPLNSVAVLGPLTVPEGSSISYTGQASYLSGAIFDFTNTAWLVTNTAGLAAQFRITTNGILATGSITSNAVVLISAPYTNGGFLYTATANVTVSNLPPPTLGSAKFLSNKSFTFTVSGVPNRSHVLEASTNLSSATNWVSLATNTTGLNGLLNFTNFPLTNFPQRFYRAREF